MYFKRSNGFTSFVILLLLQSLSMDVLAQRDQKLNLNTEIAFSAKPASCVALHQGRKCYAQVSLVWQSAQLGSFCIYQKVSNKLVQCWKDSKGSQVSFEFESSEKLEYQLVSIEKNRVLAEAAVDVSWVHKASPRKRRWRLF
ncbi:DUF3019 domain-containing protein [Colwelliaceae bacterium 6441]